MASNGIYTAIPQKEIAFENKEDVYETVITVPRVSRLFKAALATTCGLLVVSVAANVYFCYQYFVKPWDLANSLPTRYARLRREVPTRIDFFNDFQSEDLVVQNAAWDTDDLEPFNAIVALDEATALSMGLPHSQRWPWDLGRGVYVTAAAHELHCLRAVRESVNQNFASVPLAVQTWSYAHMAHCLNVLRTSIVCHADDTPMYMGHLHENVNRSEPRPGLGQIRMCRDWGALLRWTNDNSACYRPVDQFNQSYPELERFRFCPDGSRPWEGKEGLVTRSKQAAGLRFRSNI